MAVPEQIPYREYTANGVAKVFPLEFDCKEQDHLIVLVNDVEPSHGSWSFDAIADTVTFALPPLTGAIIKIQRDTPMSRSTDFQTYDNSLRPKPINDDFDIIWRKLQEMGVSDSLLKKFFLKEIENQGLAVNQLDELYNDFLQRLANVNTNKDWDAAFIAYKGSTQDIFNSNQENLNLSITNYVNPKMWGAVGDGIADDSSAIESCRNYMIANAATFNDFSESKYRHTRNITFTAPNQKLIFNGNCEFISDNNYITFTGTNEQIGHVASAAIKGSKIITLSENVSLSSNDLIAIHNSRTSSLSTHRDYYYDGEYKIVESVSSNIATLRSQLETSYPGGVDDKVWKINPISLTMMGVKFISNGLSALKIALARDCSGSFTVENLMNSAISQNALFLEKCFSCKFDSGRYVKIGISGTGTDYGVVTANSQDILFLGGYAYGGRHGCAMGGSSGDMAVPNRRVSYESMTIENNPSSLLHAADMHGNAIDCGYKNNNILGRISLSGRNPSSINNKITSSSGDIRPPIGLSEIVGGRILSINDEVISSGLASLVMGWLSSNTILKVTEDVVINIQDIEFAGNENLIGIYAIFNMPTKNSVVIDGFNLVGDAIKFDRLTGYVTGASATQPSYIQITRPKFAVPEAVSVISSGLTLVNAVKDVFSSSGTNGNGTWIKNSDGSMICTHKITGTVAINTAYAGGFKSADLPWTFPKAFIGNAPKITATNLDNSCISSKGAGTTVTQSTLFSVALTSFASAGVVIDVTAIGRHLP